MWYGHQLLVSRFLSHVDRIHAIMKDFTDPYWKYMFYDDVPNHGIRAYREHNAMVQRLATGRILVFNTKEGWEPLCKFLGKERPSTEFPHVNKTDEHRLLFGMARRQALKAFLKKLLVMGLLPSLIVLSLLWKRRRPAMLSKSLRR